MVRGMKVFAIVIAILLLLPAVFAIKIVNVLGEDDDKFSHQSRQKLALSHTEKDEKAQLQIHTKPQKYLQ